MSEPGYVLWGGEPSRSMLVEMVLAEAGQPYEVREVDFRAGENTEADFLAVNPFGWVPALTTPGGETLVETPAINLWICERHALDLVPVPGDPLRGRFLGAFHNIIGEIEPTLKRVFFPHRYALVSEDIDPTRRLAWQMLRDRVAAVERMLGEGPFFLGQRFSLADLTLAYWMTYVERAGDLAEFPAVRAVQQAAEARPGPAPVFVRLNETISAFYRRTAGK